MEAETVHHGLLLNRVRPRLEHERSGRQLAAVIDRPDFETPVFVTHLDLDFDPVRAGIVVAVLHDVDEYLLDAELHLEPVLLREPVPVGESVHRC